MAINEPAGTINPKNANYISNGSQWVLKSKYSGPTTTTPAPQKLTQNQELDAASQRLASGGGNDIDQRNVDYATKNLGYSFNVAPESPEINVNDTNDFRIEGGDGDTALSNNLQNTVTTGLTQNEEAFNNLLRREEQLNAREQEATQTRLDEAATGLETAREVSLEDTQRRLMDEFEIEETKKQLIEYKSQLAALSEEAGLSDAAIKNKPIHAAIIRGQRALKQEEFAYKAAGIQAKVAIAGEQYNLAADAVNSLFKAAAQDRQDTMSYYERLYDLEKQDLITLKKDEKDSINQQMALLLNSDERARENEAQFAQVFADPLLSKAFQLSGAELSDNFTVAMQKMAPHIRTLDAAARAAKGGNKGYKFNTSSKQALIGAGFSTGDIQRIEEGLDNNMSLDQIISQLSQVHGPTGEVTGPSQEQINVLRESFTGAPDPAQVTADDVINGMSKGMYVKTLEKPILKDGKNTFVDGKQEMEKIIILDTKLVPEEILPEVLNRLQQTKQIAEDQEPEARSFLDRIMSIPYNKQIGAFKKLF